LSRIAFPYLALVSVVTLFSGMLNGVGRFAAAAFSPSVLNLVLIAALIYLWESALWLPKRGHALRRRWFGKKWRVIPATRLLSTRELGVVPKLPVPPDSSLAPCPGFPLATDDTGAIFIETADGDFRKTDARTWDQIRYAAPHLIAGNLSIRCQSPAAMEPLREGKSLGLDSQSAIRRCAALALSPARAATRHWPSKIKQNRSRRRAQRPADPATDRGGASPERGEGARPFPPVGCRWRRRGEQEGVSQGYACHRSRCVRPGGGCPL
jgi:hypothetical protein